MKSKKPRAVYLALYKHKKPVKNWNEFIDRCADEFIRLLTKSPYSHCELAIKNAQGDYDCYSSSVRDKGVRGVVLNLYPERWDLIRLDISAEQVEAFYSKTCGMRYDWAGVFAPLFFIKQNPKRYFCSEWCYAALGGTASWRFNPAQLESAVKFINHGDNHNDR